MRQNSASVEVNLRLNFGTQLNPVIRTFVSGYSVSSDVVQVMTNPTNLKGTNLTIRVTVGVTTTLTSVTISYVAFSPSNSPFASFGGSFNQRNFIRDKVKELGGPLHQTPYKLYGLAQISLRGS